MNESNPVVPSAAMQRTTDSLGRAVVRGPHYFTYDDRHDEWRKVVHPDNPRWKELAALPALVRPAADPAERDPQVTLHDFFDVYDEDFKYAGHSLVRLYGGYNGMVLPHKWSRYLGWIAEAVDALEDLFGAAWVVEIGNSCSDVHDVLIGVTDKRPSVDGSLGLCDRDVAAWDLWKATACADGKPFALLDWGYQMTYERMFTKLHGPFPWKEQTFLGSLFHVDNTVNDIRVFGGGAYSSFFHSRFVRTAHDGTQDFFVRETTADDDGLENDLRYAKGESLIPTEPRPQPAVAPEGGESAPEEEPEAESETETAPEETAG